MARLPPRPQRPLSPSVCPSFTVSMSEVLFPAVARCTHSAQAAALGQLFVRIGLLLPALVHHARLADGAGAALPGRLRTKLEP